MSINSDFLLKTLDMNGLNGWQYYFWFSLNQTHHCQCQLNVGYEGRSINKFTKWRHSINS